MGEVLTKSMARNIFYGGSLFFIIIFIALFIHGHYYIVNVSTDSEGLTESVIRGKHVWEEKACINCHTILGEGAYFAPEVGNVMVRWDVQDDPDTAFEILKGWMDAQPSGTPGRRQMPQFNLSDEDVRALSDFLIWVSKINTQGWPPNIAG